MVGTTVGAAAPRLRPGGNILVRWLLLLALPLTLTVSVLDRPAHAAPDPETTRRGMYAMSYWDVVNRIREGMYDDHTPSTSRSGQASVSPRLLSAGGMARVSVRNLGYQYDEDVELVFNRTNVYMMGFYRPATDTFFYFHNLNPLQMDFNSAFGRAPATLVRLDHGDTYANMGPEPGPDGIRPNPFNFSLDEWTLRGAVSRIADRQSTNPAAFRNDLLILATALPEAARNRMIETTVRRTFLTGGQMFMADHQSVIQGWSALSGGYLTGADYTLDAGSNHAQLFTADTLRNILALILTRHLPSSGLCSPDPAVPSTPAEAELCPGSVVDNAPGSSMNAAFGSLAAAQDKYLALGMTVPQSYTGGHFAPGAEFGPDGYQASFTYDNAVIITSMLQKGSRDLKRAKRLGESLLYAQDHDIVPDGRIRASYEPNPFVTSTGNPYVGSFSVYTGNMAWAGMAFSRLYRETGEQRFLDGALKAANWIQTNAADTRGLGGYTGGYVDNTGTGAEMIRREWKATEHNIDVGAFFAMLAQLTGDQAWKSRSDNAFAFVRGMQADDGRLWTGTGTDGVTQNRDSVPEDVQTWSYLATLDPVFSRSVDWAATNLAATDGPFQGVSFAKADTSKVWFEGTAHLLAAYHARQAVGDDAKAAVLQKTLKDAQSMAPNADGSSIVAASSDGLTTGEGDIYYAAPHTGATAWYLIAGQGGNPFRL
ncbi:ribosome-inactivating family protein [Kitasatospora sp. NPDC058170]|uniref:ribosome-inactivating family protein n=1 Tax=Kitasatospora sp. NPDC058170 TaxID=3346364 RepID=UPI0036D7AF57